MNSPIFANLSSRPDTLGKKLIMQRSKFKSSKLPKVLISATFVALGVLAAGASVFCKSDNNFSSIKVGQSKDSEKFVTKQQLLAISPLQAIKSAQYAHYSGNNSYGSLLKFREWTNKKQWKKFSGSGAHYDWWMFPTDHFGTSCPEKSGKNALYKINSEMVKVLKKDSVFMKNYRAGVRLQLLAWGWDCKNQQPVANPDKDQKYDFYEIRLEKIAKSLIMFNEKKLHASVQQFFHYHYTNHSKNCGNSLKKVCMHKF